MTRQRLHLMKAAQPAARFMVRRFPVISYRLTHAYRLHSTKRQEEAAYAVDWWSRVLTVGSMSFLLCLLIMLLTGDVVWLLLGFVTFLGCPILRYRMVIDAAEAYREQITYELPEWLQILVIYLYAGYPVPAALQQMAKKWQHRTGPLAAALHQAAAKLSYQASLSQVLHELAEQADTNEMRSIVTILLSHTLRGGDSTLDTLLDISRQMWDKRLALVRKRAEETTVKMIFPLIVIFIAVLIIVAAPAVMFLGS